MSVKEKIYQIKDKATRVAVKAVAVATLMTGAGAVSSCQENNSNTGENKDKIERVDGTKSSVVLRTIKSNTKIGSKNNILLENGDVLQQDVNYDWDKFDRGAFLEAGDTVTYEGNEVKSIRYRNGNIDKNEDKIERDGTKSSVVLRTIKSNTKIGSKNNILLENGDVLQQDVNYDWDKFDRGAFLEAGDTVTYKGNEVKSIRYKDKARKQVYLSKICKGITD